MSPSKPPILPPERTQDLPATIAMLEEVKADLAAFKGETKAEFTNLAAFKGETKAEFAELRGEISGIKMQVEHHLFLRPNSSDSSHLTNGAF